MRPADVAVWDFRFQVSALILLSAKGGVLGEFGGVGVVKGDGGAAFGGERLGLVNEFAGEVEAGEVLVAEGVEGDGYAAGTATGFEDGEIGGGRRRENPIEHQTFAGPETEVVRGLGVVQDGA
jgi:hypothetical protein